MQEIHDDEEFRHGQYGHVLELHCEIYDVLKEMKEFQRLKKGPEGGKGYCERQRKKGKQHKFMKGLVSSFKELKVI